MKILLFLFAALFSFSVLAQQISDPNGILARADQFLGPQSFQKNFVQGMKYTQVFDDHTEDPQIINYEIQSVKDDNGGAALIVGTHNNQMNVTAANWNSWSGNMIRAVLSAVSGGGFGQIAVMDAHSGQMQVKLDGQMKTVDVFTVHATAKNQIGMTMDETMTVTPALAGYAQLITWTEKQFLGVTYTRTMTEFSH
jgi:hypothetical protein